MPKANCVTVVERVTIFYCCCYESFGDSVMPSQLCDLFIDNNFYLYYEILRVVLHRALSIKLYVISTNITPLLLSSGANTRVNIRSTLTPITQRVCWKLYTNIQINALDLFNSKHAKRITMYVVQRKHFFWSEVWLMNKGL